jgi:formylglycine-generating enzyme required for sulfatase activity
MKQIIFIPRILRRVFIILSLSIFFCLNAFSQIPGDVNSDGFINHGDYYLIKDYLMDRNVLKGDILTSADANLDDKVDVADMLTIDIHTTFSIPMIYVPAGSFIMGARNDGDDYIYRDSDELPRHKVTLSAYYIGKYEVTTGQYCNVLNWANAKGYLENSSGGAYTGGKVYKNSKELLELVTDWAQIFYNGGSFIWKYRDSYSMENHPVVEVSWYGAVAFCNWLSEKEGRTPAYDLSTWEMANKTGGGYRLPTEAEWERAAAWNGSKHWIYGYSSDDGNNQNRYNHFDDLGGTAFVNPLGLSSFPNTYTSPVGWFNGLNISPKGNIQTINSLSPVGCYDMSGNAREMCHDRYSSTYYSGGEMINPTGPASGSTRVYRGGNWGSNEENCRTAFRHGYYPSNTSDWVGFRVCLQEGGS